MRVIQAYRFALDPSPAQTRSLRSHAGAARFAWNWALQKCKEQYSTGKSWYSAPELHRLWNATKKTDPTLAWWHENSKCVYQESFRDLDRALRDYVKSKRGERKGKRLGFPRFKKRRKSRDSFRLTGALHCDGASVTLPRLGTIATHESTRKLARRLDTGTARILSATVSRTAQRWYVAFTVEVERHTPERHARAGTSVGIDLGVKAQITAVDSDGNVIILPGPKPLAASLGRLRRTSRAHSRKRPGSKNRAKSAATLSRLHARIANIRMDSLHKATTMLAKRYETIVVEDLNVDGMMRNHRLARGIMDQGFGMTRRLLAYKSAWNAGALAIADRWFPSSKVCSDCGEAKTKLSLSERVYQCETCGLVIDRDVNAARNLLNLAASGRRE